MDTFAKLIKSERIKQNLSLRKLAGMARVTHTSLFIWESGGGNITLSNANKVLRALKISMVIGEEDK